MKTNQLYRSLGLAAIMALGLNAGAEIKLPAFFGDNMVLQQNTDARMWGTADASSTVTVTPGWTSEKYTTKADNDGKWKITIPTPSAGGPYDVTVSDGTPLTLNNVMLGEVWLCSGQSNMEMPMKGFKNQPVEGANMAILKSRNPDIRLFTVKRNSSTVPVDDVTGSWAEASPATVRNFSATAYFFGRQIEELLDVPVGLIVVSWGGSACEAWMNDEMLQAFPEAAANIPAVDGKIPSKNRTPSVLFKGMLNPLIGLAMRGVIWYQGEDNWNRAHSYTDMFSTMIKGWRDLWGQGEFPFYYCQIAPYDYAIITEPGKEIINSAYLREAQARVEHIVPNTGMAVLMDAGWPEGIHPPKKQVAGERLALLALNKTYGIEGIGAESPVYKSMEVKGDTVVVSFDRAPEWIAGKNSFESKQFQLAGEDRVFHPAKAWISRSKIMVKSDAVPHPVAVRYAFENASEGDLFSTDGLPVSSFRSDDWPDARPIKE
ncbi:MAG: sialate O-acetylesterase [Duncaniella sp.]|uniref:sialate O-acetylesterase n=1 Tax=Duncaniella sp. TaxID=2518496 RepID=UPI0023BB329A|nr:sialate O-acetylesterase [Duncaniella sp.]MDE6089505.1 sialate O-acetylesterase [Duncaniella sp.]